MSDFVLQIRDPWTMPLLECADGFIEALHKSIGPRHPLFRRQVYPVAVRRRPDAVLYETDDEPELYALVLQPWSGDWSPAQRGRAPKTTLLPDLRAIQALIDSEHEIWSSQFRPSQDAQH